MQGNIPTILNNLLTLEELDISDNQLQSNIPPTLMNVHKTNSLYLSRNQLSGSLLLFANLSLLAYLYGSGNYLNGSIPSTLMISSSFEKLDLS